MSFRKVNLSTAVNTTTTTFDDTLIVLGGNNFSGDIGFLGKRAANTYAGLVRDNETNKFVLIDSFTVSLSSNNIDVENGIYTKAKLDLQTLESNDVIVNTTFVAPKGNTNSRPANPVEGQIWFNTDTKMFEGFDGTEWLVFVPATLEMF